MESPLSRWPIALGKVFQECFAMSCTLDQDTTAPSPKPELYVPVQTDSILIAVSAIKDLQCSVRYVMIWAGLVRLLQISIGSALSTGERKERCRKCSN